MRRIALGIAGLALVACSGLHQKDEFRDIADIRKDLSSKKYSLEQESSSRWRLSYLLFQATSFYDNLRPVKNQVNPFSFVKKYCDLSNENEMEARALCVRTGVCEDLPMIEGNNRMTQANCGRINLY